MSHHGHSVTSKTMKTAHGAVHGGRHFRTSATTVFANDGASRKSRGIAVGSASNRSRTTGTAGPRMAPLVRKSPRPRVCLHAPAGRPARSVAWFPLIVAAGLLIGESAAGQPEPHPPRHAGVSVATRPLRPAATCGGDFETHRLEHTTRVYGGVPLLFDSHGSGVAAGDLDRDGDADLVLANVAGESSLLWNLGGLRFRRQALNNGPTRAVNLVDLDADGWLDIVFTRQGGLPVWRRNSGAGMHGEAFARAAPLLTPNHAFTMAWADLDGDGDLDLVTGSYDAELVATMGPDGLHGAGVYYHERRPEELLPTRLATRAEALAILLLDLDGDRRLDILVGNDFAEPDRIWLRQADGWHLSELFSSMSLNTMSLAAGDLDNDGVDEIFSADMKPYTDDPGILEFYGPMPEPRTEAVQVSANALLVRRSGGYDNHAAGAGVDASGWSWAAQFGDLDNDGFLDLYVVNGMMSEELFAHLAAYALVEENQVYRNDGSGAFQPMPEWRLGSIASGRGMVMVDLDGDGDLDIVVNNLLAPAQLFENRLCHGGAAILVAVRWPGGTNTGAIGSRLVLHTGAGELHREITASSGYLSGNVAAVHFGFPRPAGPLRLQIHWPDGATSIIDQPPPDTRITVTRE